MNLLAVLAMALVGVGALLLYLASPNQLAFVGGAQRKWLAWPGTAFALLGTGLLLRWGGTAAAIFTAVTLIMLVWTLIPLAVAWRRGDRKAPR